MCLRVRAIVRMLMCVVSRPTGSPAGEMGERDKKTAALLVSALQGSGSGEDCRG